MLSVERSVPHGLQHVMLSVERSIPMSERQYCVYILANQARTIYVGVTNDLQRRVNEHKDAAIPGFTARYRVNRLVYYELTDDIRDAIAREKQIKGWLRAKKIQLIEAENPRWRDLSLDWSG